jgi:hypothetical protein
MELEDLLTEAARLLAQFSAEVKAASAASLTDISTASDMFLLELLRETFGLKDLRSLNAERANFPGLDLADDTARVAFQITAERDLGKILSTLKTSMAHGLHKRYPKIRVFVISERQRRYKQATIDSVTRVRFPDHRDRSFRLKVTDFGLAPGIAGHDPGILGHVPPE